MFLFLFERRIVDGYRFTQNGLGIPDENIEQVETTTISKRVQPMKGIVQNELCTTCGEGNILQ